MSICVFFDLRRRGTGARWAHVWTYVSSKYLENITCTFFIYVPLFYISRWYDSISSMFPACSPGVFIFDAKFWKILPPPTPIFGANAPFARESPVVGNPSSCMVCLYHRRLVKWQRNIARAPFFFFFFILAGYWLQIFSFSCRSYTVFNFSKTFSPIWHINRKFW